MAETQTPRGSLLPLVSTLLVGTVALYMALVAFSNITDFGTNQQFVRHVLAMDTTFKDEDLMWRAIESKGVQDTAYVLIIIWETVAALVLVAATYFWARALGHRTFHTARRYSTLGLLMVLLLFGAGFMAIGGEYFVMWQSGDWNGLDAALRVFLLSGVVLMVTYLPTRETGAN
jgi:predicted small integral membrane protein